jgi:hypothetical protein
MTERTPPEPDILPFRSAKPYWIGRALIPIVVAGTIVEVRLERYYIEAATAIEGEVHVDPCHPDEVFTCTARDLLTSRPCRLASAYEVAVLRSLPG